MSDKQPTLSIVIPCFNEADGLDYLVSKMEDLLKQINEPCELVFVDDGSSDSTYERLIKIYNEKNGNDVKIVRHLQNQGLGAAVRTGFLNSKGDYIAMIDSDCTYEPTYILEMFDVIKREEADLVTASAFHPKGSVFNVPFYRQLLSRNLSRLYNLILGSKYYTFTCMVRVYRKAVLEKIDFKSTGFLSVAEIFVKAHKGGFKIIEYPTTLTVRKYGASKAKILKMIKEHIGFIIRLLLKKEGKI